MHEPQFVGIVVRLTYFEALALGLAAMIVFGGVSWLIGYLLSFTLGGHDDGDVCVLCGGPLQLDRVAQVRAAFDEHSVKTQVTEFRRIERIRAAALLN
jgi:hypothetical protein